MLSESNEDDVHNYINSKWASIVEDAYKDVFIGFDIDNVDASRSETDSEITIRLSNGDTINVHSRNSPLESVIDVNGEVMYHLKGRETIGLPEKVHAKYVNYLSK